MAGIFAKSFQAFNNGKDRIVKDLGLAWDETGQSRRPFQCNVRMQFLEKSGPGKKLHFDAAVCRYREGGVQPSSSFFDQRPYYAFLRIAVHNINGSWRELNGFKVNGSHKGPSQGNWVDLGVIKPKSLIHDQCWSKQSIKPRYGCVQANYRALTPTGINTGMTASSAHSTLASRYTPYSNNSITTFFAGEPVGVRYLSNHGWCGNDGHRRSQVGNLSAYRDFTWAQLDDGTDSLGPIIEFESGTGEDYFNMDFRVYVEGWNGYYFWDVHEDTLKYKIDNPLMGFPDVKKEGQYGEGWPPRYDAQFFKFVAGQGWKSQKELENLQGKRKASNNNDPNDWKVF